MSKHDAQIHEDIGYIKGIVEGIDKKVTDQNSEIADLKKKVTRHEVILGKIGAVFSAIVFGLTLAFNLFVEWLKKLLH